MQTRTRNTSSEMAAQENSFDQGKRDMNNFGQRGSGSVYQKRSARNQFQDSMHTLILKVCFCIFQIIYLRSALE
ncbi:hypothetical protein YC2023_088820 [Brassica napus]